MKSWVESLAFCFRKTWSTIIVVKSCVCTVSIVVVETVGCQWDGCSYTATYIHRIIVRNRISTENPFFTYPLPAAAVVAPPALAHSPCVVLCVVTLLFLLYIYIMHVILRLSWSQKFHTYTSVSILNYLPCTSRSFFWLLSFSKVPYKL